MATVALSCFIFQSFQTVHRKTLFDKVVTMEDDNESIDVLAKVQEMHIIQIFGFDGKL
jgi:hypothetical protein